MTESTQPREDFLPKNRIAVVGGGITGLAACWELEGRASADVTLFESSGNLGGVLRTDQIADYVVENSADMFTTKDPWAIELCREMEFENELIPTNSQFQGAFVVRRGRLHRVPEGLSLLSPTKALPVLLSPLLSWPGRLRMMCEPFIRARHTEQDESLASFTTRRLGREAYEHLIQPLIGGIYTADPEKLSMKAALPQFLEMERKSGSIIRASRKKKSAADGKASGARYGLFRAPRHGMSQWVSAIQNKLTTTRIQLNSPVETLTIQDNGCSINGELFDHVILATNAYAAAKLLEPSFIDLSKELEAIPMAGASVVACGFKRTDVEHPANGFGVVVPAVENRNIIAISFSSVKFDGRAPDDRLLLRVFVGGALQPQLLELDDDETEQIVMKELRDLLGVRANPEFSRVYRWSSRMPQYHIGHTERVERIEQLVKAVPRLELAGNAYRGVGIPFCIRSGREAAKRVLD